MSGTNFRLDVLSVDKDKISMSNALLVPPSSVMHCFSCNVLFSNPPRARRYWNSTFYLKERAIGVSSLTDKSSLTASSPYLSSATHKYATSTIFSQIWQLIRQFRVCRTRSIHPIVLAPPSFDAQQCVCLTHFVCAVQLTRREYRAGGKIQFQAVSRANNLI